MNIQQAIAKVVERENLSEAEMTPVFGEIMSGAADVPEAQGVNPAAPPLG